MVKPARVMARIVTSPHADRGESVILWLDSRTVSDPSEVVYSITRDEWRVEHHRHLMWRTRRANPTELEEAREVLERLSPTPIQFLQGAPRAEGADEMPARDERGGSQAS